MVGGMRPKLVTGRSFAFAFASTTLSIKSKVYYDTWLAALSTQHKHNTMPDISVVMFSKTTICSILLRPEVDFIETL